MRTIRALTAAVAVAAALPTIAAAQQGRQFKDAWFWGVKGGGLTLADTNSSYTQAPMAGFDWLITRTRGGLYISASQAFFTQQTFTLRDASAGVDSGLRVVDLKNLRKLDMALMAFPGQHVYFHPYVGLGLTLGQVASATPEPPFATVDQLNAAEQDILNRKVGVSPFLIAGGQYRFRPMSVFVQGTANPVNKDFLLYNGKPWNFTIEAGIRYNVGTSIDRQ
jgi:hypothetical protein